MYQRLRLLSVWVLAVTSLGGASAGAQRAGAPPGHRPMPQLPGGNHGPCGSCSAPVSLSASTAVTAPGERGEPLELSGVLYEPDGRTRATGVGFFVYHTDARGYYNAWRDESDPRLRGWLRTDDHGRYRFRTVRPGAYPGGTVPAHIHATYWSANCAERWIDDYFFADDPLLSPRLRTSQGAPFSQVVALQRDSSGTWKGTRDVRLPQRCGTEAVGR